MKILGDARSYARPYVRLIRGRAQASWNDIAKKTGVGAAVYEPLAEQWRRVLRNSQSILGNLPEKSDPRILFATGWGLSQTMITLESILSTALRMRGATPTVLACNKSLPACEFHPLGNFSLPQGLEETSERQKLEKCRICTENIYDVVSLLPVDKANFSEVLGSDDLKMAVGIVDSLNYDQYKNFIYRDVHVGEHAFSSVMRATLRGTLIDDEPTRLLYRRYLVSAILIVNATEKLFSQLKINRLIAVHGVYVTQGTICELARRENIPVSVYGTPYRLNTVWLSHRDTYHRTLITEPCSLWENIEMTPERTKRVDDYISEKRFGGRDYLAFHANAENDPEAIKRALGLDNKRPIISLFTNVLWDAQLYYSYNAFSGLLEWLFETIRYFERHPELQLVIRIHPAEAKGLMPTRQPLLAEIQREFPVLKDNIKIVPAESSLSSYTLAEISQAALIYGARMGVEIAALGTPLVVAGESFNRRKGFSYDVEAREQYFSILDKISTLTRNSPEMVLRAKKYMYHLYFRLMIDFPLFSVEDAMHLSRPRLAFDDLSALKEGKCPALDLICNGIKDAETPFIYDGD
jgi:hypothetical protein